jgi:hypothetical protein
MVKDWGSLPFPYGIALIQQGFADMNCKANDLASAILFDILEKREKKDD